MKTLPANIATEVIKQITTPFYIVEMYFEKTNRYSTRQQVRYAGSDFTSGFIQVMSVGIKAKISMDNSQNMAAALAFQDKVRDRKIKIWVAYGTLTDLTDDDVELIFDGVMLNVSSVTQTTIIVECALMAEGLLFSPRIYCGNPIHSFLIPPGTLLGNYKLESDRS